MYKDTLNVANKIITVRDLEEIFLKMYEEIESCNKQHKLETIRNEKHQREQQNWTVKNYNGKITANINFYDNTEISFDKYQIFINIFNNRLHEIKNLRIRYSCNYSRKEIDKKEEFIMQYIYIDIHENKIKISINLNSDDTIMDNVYESIKHMILSAPIKYDKIIEKKTSIYNKIGFSIIIPPKFFLNIF